MHFHSTYLLLCTLFLLSARSCTKDTCNKEPTFAQISLTEPDPQVQDGKLPVKLSFSLKTTLPDDYFKAVVTDQGREDRFGKPWDNDFEAVASVQMTATGAALQLKQEALTEANQKIGLHFVLPDRRNFIPCDHPGGSDSYLLDIDFTVEKTQNSYRIKDIKWKEELKKGPF